MEWIKSSIETTSQGVDVVTYTLMECGISGVEIIDSKERAKYLNDTTRTWDYADESLLVADDDNAYVVFYVTDDGPGKNQLSSICDKLKTIENTPNIGTLTLRTEQANDETWLNEWKKHFMPIHIGRIVVVPEWIDYSPTPGEVIFKIDPGTAFGTGQHQTTQLCISAMEKQNLENKRVLDVGCGSGILSIISMLVGANYVCAIDIDPAGAIAATKNNAKLNPIDLNNIKVTAGDVITDPVARAEVGSHYDVVIANIVADVIIPLAPVVNLLGKPGGLFIASGIITERLEDVLNAFASANIRVIAQEEKEGWNSITGILSNG